uniref:nectin-2-like n=1 Tax=Pristiophorus japonicus TaxID=55135 RepID=UPI00398F2968
MKPVILQCLLSSVWPIISTMAYADSRVTIHVLESVTGYTEQAVVLPCRLTSPHTQLVVVDITWKKVGEPVNVAVHSPTLGTNYPAQPNAGRIHFCRHSPHGTTLVISNVSRSDAGVYVCYWTTFPQGTFSNKTTLDVFDTMPITYGKFIILGLICVVLVLGLLLITGILVKLKNKQNQAAECNAFGLEMDECCREIVYASLNLHQKAGCTPPRNGPSEDIVYGAVKQN